MRRMLNAVVLTLMMGGAVFTAGPASASQGGSVARYQIETLSITVAVSSNNVHEYSVTLNPCDNTFVGTGGGFYGLGGSKYVSENVTGSYVGDILSLNSTYVGGWSGSTYSYSLASLAVPMGTATSSAVYADAGGKTEGPYSVDVTIIATGSTSWANHGAFVSANPGSMSAQSCIGMPMQSSSTN